MSRWWRAEDTSIDHPKLLGLSDAMHRAWYTLMCVASANGGALPPASDIALRLRMKPAKISEWITTLVHAELFDNRDGVFVPHNWEVRQYKSDVTDPTAAERMKRYRNKKRNGESNDRNATVTVIRPETEAETDTEQKQKTKTRAPALDDDWPADFGDQFWQAYPRKTEKLAAMEKLKRLRKQGIVTFSDLMAGVHRYAAAVKTTDPKYVKQPPTWLNAGCWADEIQTGGRNGDISHGAQQRRSSNADFFAGIASVAADIARDGPPSGFAGEEVPLGRVNIDG